MKTFFVLLLFTVFVCYQLVYASPRDIHQKEDDPNLISKKLASQVKTNDEEQLADEGDNQENEMSSPRAWGRRRRRWLRIRWRKVCRHICRHGICRWGCHWVRGKK